MRGQINNLEHFRDGFFREAIRRHIIEYQRYYQQRLLAIYIRGSVHRNEGIQGVSDLDFVTFLRDECAVADRSHWSQHVDLLHSEFPNTNGFGPAYSLERFKRDAGGRQILRHDATLVWGDDLLTDEELPPPDHFDDVRNLTRYEAGLEKENLTDHRLPDDLSLKLRKYARMAVLAGASLLVLRGRFHSFCGADVIPAITQMWPEWCEFMDETNRLFMHVPRATKTDVDKYFSKLMTWVEWISDLRQVGGFRR